MPREPVSDQSAIDEWTSEAEPVMREFHGRALLYGEAAAEKWLAARVSPASDESLARTERADG